ncbi:uroporphyrinogen-III synthase [Alisedimentitalea sp. MJ-SS2]|uniref:uroporphyrinogen-III synthase n=1 Tax=Aliisedimentitalea sp. MJ-SS2 TaxID=3049795 RepID=UPI0029106F46|nr:uroporphyrinogen-III synthase [Alisedimentitalea sp. MJ-SS2]MDU8927925.1 uroporphyrinogen-III synthase [Alisedimentitalea sp. MJ-SS2]
MPAILLTRPTPAATGFAETLRAVLGDVEIVISPLLQIEWIGVELPAGRPIFTSKNGIEGYLHSGGEGIGACWCVGEATAQAAAEAGFAPMVGGGDAKDLIKAIRDSGDKGPFVHCRGAHARGNVALTLQKMGLSVVDLVVYDQQVQDLSDQAKTLLESEKPVVLPLFSPRTATQFSKVHCGQSPLFIAVMSNAVLAALGELRFDGLAIADRPDAQAMLEATERLFDAALRLEGVSGAK